MARPRGPNELTSYQAQPEVPPAQERRFQVLRAVLGNRTTISEAAKTLGIARVNMQTLVHRAEAAILEVLTPRPPGRKARPAAEQLLAAQRDQLAMENERLRTQLKAADQMMGAAGEIIRSLRGLAPTSSRTSSGRSKRSPRAAKKTEDPEAATLATSMCRALAALTETHDAARCAQVLGVDPKTLRRWRARVDAGELPIKRRGGTMVAGPPAAEAHVRELVVAMHGLPGAASLAHSVEGVSRRRAQQIKAATKTNMEQQRKAAASRVVVTAPGVIRGFDAMYLPDGLALIAADACVPYRTSARHVERYDAVSVAATLDEDFATNGAPLVIRLDRATCHTAEPVLSVLRAHRVMLLHGPAHHPQYYGQLERQNREHRHWCDPWEGVSTIDQSALDQMRNALNALWRRPTLAWRTAADCWTGRGAVDHERDSFTDDVMHRAERLHAKSIATDLAARLAIEQALIAKGYLRVTAGRTALCD